MADPQDRLRTDDDRRRPGNELDIHASPRGQRAGRAWSRSRTARPASAGPHKDARHFEDFEGFLIDRHEVTNAEYQRFVDSGGYENRKYWTQPFTRNGAAVTPDEAIASFRDGTGRPGRSTWQAGRHPTGQSEHPVSGVSWFEAAAYAEFVGKSLPTVYHWTLAAQTNGAEFIVPGSNFLSDHTQPVGQPGALSGFGTSDMAGNVKEWCLNQGWEGKNFILGGGFGGAAYQFAQTDAASPWDRRPDFGFRCVRLYLLRLLRRPPRNWRRASETSGRSSPSATACSRRITACSRTTRPTSTRGSRKRKIPPTGSGRGSASQRPMEKTAFPCTCISQEGPATVAGGHLFPRGVRLPDREVRPWHDRRRTYGLPSAERTRRRLPHLLRHVRARRRPRRHASSAREMA